MAIRMRNEAVAISTAAHIQSTNGLSKIKKKPVWTNYYRKMKESRQTENEGKTDSVDFQSMSLCNHTLLFNTHTHTFTYTIGNKRNSQKAAKFNVPISHNAKFHRILNFHHNKMYAIFTVVFN